MVSPVATVDGNVYDREYIEQWIRTCRQRQQPITSPLTGVELPATKLIPPVAVQKAIEAYVANRPELRL